MKNSFTLLIALVSITINAQIVNIPDPNLKAQLVSYDDGQGFILDANGDGEIQVSEAQSMTILSIGQGDESITDLTGIEAFINMESFSCNQMSITTLDLSPFTHLKEASCGDNPFLTTVNVTGLAELRHLELEIAAITNIIGLSSLVSLKYFDISQNPMTSIDLTGLASLRKFICLSGQLSSIVFPEPNQLKALYLANNPFSSLDITPLHYVEPESEEEFPVIELYGCMNLEYINMKNGGYSPLYEGSVTNCPNLRYICADEQEVEMLQEILAESGIQINTYCSFVPGGNHNTITGDLTLDLDNNGCDDSDLHYPGIKILINDGSDNGATFTNHTGNYNFFTRAGNFTITPQFENPFFTISPASATVNFETSDNVTQTQHFCLTSNGIHNDLDVVLYPISAARPGFDAMYNIVYTNKGNQTLSGTVNFAFDDSAMDFLTAEPTASSQSENSISWDFANLQPFESRAINLTVNMNSPMEIPAVNIHDILNFTATVIPVEIDETPLDNVSALAQTVIGSFDPNDKTCIEGENILPEKIGDYLHYVIRFQNSGTAPAENVVVKDLIDNTKFEIDSFQLISASHPNVTRVSGNKVEFIFQNIDLPAEQDDEPGSHGYVSFKIRTKSDLV
jgi:uncharacterized repeat protein (TIGR01451 family)